MEIIRGLANLTPQKLGNVVTIGNFDGVHLGHQAILQQVTRKATELGLPSSVITFQPSPQSFFSPDSAPTVLSPFRDKMQLLKEFGINRVVSIPFNQTLADLTASAFIQQILHKGLNVRHLVIGDDFRFGKNRQGDFEFLRKNGEELGFSIENTETYCYQNERISSTRVRRCLEKGDISTTRELLGRSYAITGKVAHGDKRGRTIGFPTANIALKRQIAPTNGVYAVKITGLENSYRGVANIGVRPTVDGNRYLLETHIFNFDQNIYGKNVQIHFEHFIRPEQRFDGLDALVAQIKLDTQTANSLLLTEYD